jgi:beta-glucosidase-like glycosyl hydrolase
MKPQGKLPIIPIIPIIWGSDAVPGHGQIPGCTATDCPASMKAGLDMYMTPDSWKALYASTLKAAQDGTLPMPRLNDAVARAPCE